MEGVTYQQVDGRSEAPVKKKATEPNRYWNILGFIILGFIIGCILMLLVVLAMYWSNSGPFSYCSSGPMECRSLQYFNNPTDALRNGAQLNEILTLSGNNMTYKRVPKDVCSPGSNQVVAIKYPQYCNFTDSSGNTVEYRDSFFEANLYVNGTTRIETSGSCQPTTSGYTGSTVLKWDS